MGFSKNILFFCYDIALQRKLKEHGVRFITTAITNDGRRFWLYFRTDEVIQIMKEYLNKN